MLNIGEGSSKYVKVWKVEEKNGIVKGQVSSSTKNQNGEYENSTWFPIFTKGCKDKALALGEGATIEITKGGFTNKYDKDKKVTYYNLLIFDFDETGNSGGSTKPAKKEVDVDFDDDVPF